MPLFKRVDITPYPNQQTPKQKKLKSLFEHDGTDMPRVATGGFHKTRWSDGVHILISTERLKPVRSINNITEDVKCSS